MPSGSERRKFARLDLALSISYKVAGHNMNLPSDPRETVSSDVSLGGVRLMAPSKLDNGTMLDLEIFLGEGETPIKAEGEVVWQQKVADLSFETGVMIKDMPQKDRSRFMQFVFDQMAKMVHHS